MKLPPYRLLNTWITLFEADYNDESYFHSILMMEQYCGSIEEAYELNNWLATHLVMKAVYNPLLAR